MKYFLTGATGFIGKVLARQLVSAGHTVIAVVRDPAKAGDLAQMGIHLRQGDVTDKESLRAPMQGVDGVYHVAGWYKVGSRDKTSGQRVNVQGTRNVLELMGELNIPKGVYTSTLAVYSDTHGKLVDENYRFTGKHLSIYDRTKWEAHYEVAEPMMKQGLPLVIVQPGLVYGPGDTSSVRATLIQYLQRKLPLLPQRTAFCWAHVEDTANAHLLAMEKGRPGENYNICGPVHTFIEAIELAEKITGIPGPRLHAPPGLMKLSAALMSCIDPFFPLPESYTGEGMRIIAGTTYTASNAKARSELGFSPRPLESGWKETVEHEMKLLGMK